MILQELINLYDRLETSEDTEIWKLGFSPESIHYAIIIDREGHFKGLDDYRTIGSDGKLHPSVFVVPKREGKRAGKANENSPYFLWDNSQFVLGVEVKNKKTKPKPQSHSFFVDKQKRILEETKASNKDVTAVMKFLESGQAKEKLLNSEEWKTAVEENLTGVNLSFIIEDSENDGFVFEQEEIKQIWRDYYAVVDQDVPQRYCLVTGKKAPVYRLQPTIKKGVGNGGKNDIPLISFNEKVFESYNLSGNENAQINRFSAGKFTHALNYLTMENKHNLRIADTLTLFWAENNRSAEHFFSGLMDRPDTDDEERRQELETFLKEMQKGKLPSDLADDSRFFVLGLAPNSARISVRFWHTDTVSKMGKKVASHYQDLKIIPQNKEKDSLTPSIWQLLIETASQHKSANIPPNIAGPVMRSILSGTRYPSNLLSILIGRMRTDQEYRRLNYYRVAFIKAILNRNFNKELTVALDADRKTAPYSLGRLFAVLERTQEDASGGSLNATIKDRYFASASATPRVVFPVIIKLAQNHLKKIKSTKPGLAVNKEKLIGEIMEDISDFPKSLKLEDQGEFAIGYYHQRQDFFKKKQKKITETEGEM
ncbi:type I-C CRISPR-associated protein Cas8c/Csd1 [Chitinivibrio alkaliphilus]|uniref:CRISPR-associated protein Cas8c/Csd1 n=1 Tax=Chitinivibrio alkaliphilus ACht1 TaxID=1313304 RepID=U7DB68_9BACT|nr:type I-C CRISPR-associated protein Cas8c/Csd1 [Chitinivibrio alkaliphilus]ERP31665.1 CRISPR-associated protein Cas8c/Csd1 [Chitinivibrio alkaliphilus ACht1]